MLGKCDDGVREWVDVGARGVKRRVETNVDVFVLLLLIKWVYLEEIFLVKFCLFLGWLGVLLLKIILWVCKSVDALAFIKLFFGKLSFGKLSWIMVL